MMSGLAVNGDHFFSPEFTDYILNSSFAHPRQSTQVSIPAAKDTRMIFTVFPLVVHHTIDGILPWRKTIRDAVQNPRLGLPPQSGELLLLWHTSRAAWVSLFGSSALFEGRRVTVRLVHFRLQSQNFPLYLFFLQWVSQAYCFQWAVRSLAKSSASRTRSRQLAEP